MLKHKTLISDPINPSLISFKPRQVLLANQNMKHVIDKPSAPALKSEQKALLLRSVAGYLNSNGFSKTLKKLLSEAQIQKDDFIGCTLDLEDMCYKYLEAIDHGNTNFSRQNVQDLFMNGNSKGIKEANVVVGVGVGKKKKKRRDWNGDGDGDGDAIVIQSEESGKFADYKEIKQVILDDMVPELNKKSTEKRKSKKISDAIGEVEQVSIDLLKKSTDDGVRDSELHESEKKHKEKKKKSKLDSSGTESKKDDNKTFEEDATVKEKSKSSKKRKRLDGEENNTQPIYEKEVEESKRRKTKGSEEQKESYKVAEVKASLGTNEDASKQSKDHLGQVNANLEKEYKSSLHKSVKEVNGSAEPRTVVQAFQRVKVDEVDFTDERLKDNSYWAKDGADSGYGAKAQEVLGQVRGRDFRHEKTKKKRGSYRGGQIDLQSHSIKFSYSEED
ncbi:nucleolar and coiled-body phosphoprotein 1 [Pistacia vera]|uniref:nucleolar and coiled-body phosphoprotein 1 n=1 Tax=Pistacia vera TaxID=55513 RepID=UPI001263B7ED|nr:nucleolar and coiled-body phosphoprotein 1 [Pistacia vera]